MDKQLATLRDGDDSIAGALAGVETQLAAWLSAMREGQAAIVAGLRPIDPVGEPTVTPVSQAAPPPTPSDETKEPVTEKPAAVNEPDSVGVSEPGQAAPRSSRLFQTPVPRGGGIKADDRAPEVVAGADGQPSQEDDEALLAQLDEETASLIRVKRRLGSNKRSVRELLDELRAGHEPGGAKSQQRTRWWRRPNERQSD
ncbi:MAG: hypothetical protein KKB50_01805 [Planctomycetes bacterium]|nr:hypothetical protein [Planctomycetota bacterium]